MTQEEKLASILIEIQERQCAGETLRLEDLLLEHPEVADELNSCLRALSMLDGAPEPARKAAGWKPAGTASPSRYAGFEKVGEGGMGIVYLAVDNDLNREVAFKIVRPPDRKPGELPTSPHELVAPKGDSPASRAFETLKSRFLQEAWVTGGLAHPGIVPVYELGLTPQEVPYYTMRFVRGERTLKSAIRDAVGIDARLALLEPFLKVCDAIHYAHSKGVVHRDLKPANIALGEFGEVVVLDWGLAKMREGSDPGADLWQQQLAEYREEHDFRTRADVLGTPGYMSPEAARGDIENLDEQSDVYSLGAMLFEILTGRLPFEFRTLTELIGKLQSESPPSPADLEPALPSRLAEVCAKAISTRPEDRQAGAGEFAGAIRTWQRESAVDREVEALLREAETGLEAAESLKGEAQLRQIEQVTSACSRVNELRPEEPTADLIRERARMTRERAIAERERGARRRLAKRVGVAGLAAAVLIAVVVSVLLNARRQEAEAAKDRAESERARAEDLAQFMLFDLREGLEPIGRLDLLGKVAEKALEYYRTQPLEQMTGSAVRSHALAIENLGDVLLITGRLDEADESFRKSLSIREDQLAQAPSDAARMLELSVSLDKVGTAALESGDLDRAMESLRRALDLERSVAERAPSDVARRRSLVVSLTRVGSVAMEMGDLDRGRALYEEALAIARGIVESDPSNAEARAELAAVLEHLGDAAEATGDPETALECFRESLEIDRRLIAQDPNNFLQLRSLAVSLESYGEALLDGADPERALECFLECLSIDRRLINQDPTNTRWRRDLSVALNHLGDTHKALGAYDDAGKAYREALEVRRRLAEEDPTNHGFKRDVSLCLDNLGHVALEARSIKAALGYYREAMQIRRELLRENPTNARWMRDLSLSLGFVGYIQRGLGEIEAARVTFGEALDIRRRLVEMEPENAGWCRDLSVTLEKVGDLEKERGSLESALECYRESLRIRQRVLEIGPESATTLRDLAVSHALVGTSLSASGHVLEALEHFRKGEMIHLRAASLDHHLAGEHQHWVDSRKSAELLAGIRRPEGPRDHLALAEAHLGQEAYSAAVESFESALTDEGIRADLDRGYLYNAACAAARASADGTAPRHRHLAVEWLREDLERRRKLLEKTATGLLDAELPQADRHRLLRAQRMLEQHIEYARTQDTDLESLRGLKQFAELFED